MKTKNPPVNLNLRKVQGIKTFTVAIQYDGRTRWLKSDADICTTLGIMARALVSSSTAGPEPACVAFTTTKTTTKN